MKTNNLRDLCLECFVFAAFAVFVLIMVRAANDEVRHYKERTSTKETGVVVELPEWASTAEKDLVEELRRGVISVLELKGKHVIILRVEQDTSLKLIGSEERLAELLDVRETQQQ